MQADSACGEPPSCKHSSADRFLKTISVGLNEASVGLNEALEKAQNDGGGGGGFTATAIALGWEAPPAAAEAASPSGAAPAGSGDAENFLSNPLRRCTKNGILGWLEDAVEPTQTTLVIFSFLIAGFSKRRIQNLLKLV